MEDREGRNQAARLPRPFPEEDPLCPRAVDALLRRAPPRLAEIPRVLLRVDFRAVVAALFRPAPLRLVEEAPRRLDEDDFADERRPDDLALVVVLRRELADFEPVFFAPRFDADLRELLLSRELEARRALAKVDD